MLTMSRISIASMASYRRSRLAALVPKAAVLVKAVPAEVAIAIAVAAVADVAQAGDMVATAEEDTLAAAVAADGDRIRIYSPEYSCKLSEGRRDAALFYLGKCVPNMWPVAPGSGRLITSGKS
jgi:hypothetical protein